jgi:hypothetical protein
MKMGGKMKEVWGATRRGGWRTCAAPVALCLLALCCSLATTGCEDDGKFARVDEARLIAIPEIITFDATAIDETKLAPVQIRNDSEVSATIKFRLAEQATANDQNREFSWPPGLEDIEDEEVVLGPNDTIQLTVAYTPRDTHSDTGVIIASYNGDELRIPITTSETSPEIDSPSRVIFGRVPAGGEVSRDFVIQNVGRAPLELYGFNFESNAEEFTLCFPQGDGDEENGVEETCLNTDAATNWQNAMEFEQVLRVRIIYTPIDDGEDRTKLLVDSNDPSYQGAAYGIEVIGNGAEPCIIVSEEEGVDFGPSFIGGVSSRTMTITNCSPTKELEVNGLEMTADSDIEFSIGSMPPGLPEEPTTIDIGATASFVLNYAPSAEATNQGTLRVLSNDEAKSPLDIPVYGRGSTNVCPTAVAKARVQGSGAPYLQDVEAIPLNTIQLSAEGSTDPDDAGNPDAIASYQWSIIEHPADSTARIAPRDDIANPTLFMDLAGRYIVELTVYDAQNIPSCEPARVTIIATPDEDIHYQLVWDTDGTDVDAHFLHPNGRWNASPWDVYYLNPEPNWGARARSDDDPSLDIDDVNGYGPENINLNNPENVSYRVGAYYFSDQGRGASNVTVRIWLQSVLQFEYRGKYMTNRQFWDVAAINWGPAPGVSQIDIVTNDFP